MFRKIDLQWFAEPDPGVPEITFESEEEEGEEVEIEVVPEGEEKVIDPNAPKSKTSEEYEAEIESLKTQANQATAIKEAVEGLGERIATPSQPAPAAPVPLLMQMENPQIPPIVKQAMTKAYTGAARLLEQTFKFFGEQDTKRYVPDYEKLEVLNEIKEAMQGDIGQMKQVLEAVRGQGNTGQIPGAEGQGVPNQGQRRSPGTTGTSRMGAQVPGIQRPAGTAGPLT